MDLYSLLKNIGRSIQLAEADMAAYGESLFLRDYDDGKPVTRSFNLPDGGEQHLPATTLKHHRPLGHKKVTVETEVEVSFHDDEKDESPILVRLKRGLRRNSAVFNLKIEYDMREPTEGVAILHENILDKVHEVPETRLTPAKPIKEK